MKYPLSDFTAGIEPALRDATIRTVTVFVSPKNPKTDVIRVSRYGNRLVVSFGRPNSKTRAFLALCKKAKTSPKKTWLQFKKKGK